MKTLKLFSVITAFMLISSSLFAQKEVAQLKENTFKVWGNCDMCKTTIEKAAISAGATEAVWDVDTKMISVKYVDNNTTSLEKIQSAIALKGYDNDAFKGNDKAYKKLHACCQYDRKDAVVVKAACGMSCCEKSSCCKADDKCCADKTCKKDDGCCNKSTCKDDCKKHHD